MSRDYEYSHGHPHDRHRHDRHPGAARSPRGPSLPGSSGGVPDGLLMGVLALLLAITVLTWTATGLAGLLAHGSWPEGVTFVRTPMAIRDLAADPQDLSGAWPDVKPSQLSGHGLFWGLFIGQLLVALVLAVFTVGTVTRARAVRAARRTRASAKATEADAADEDVRTQASPEGNSGNWNPREALHEPASTAPAPTPTQAPQERTAHPTTVPNPSPSPNPGPGPGSGVEPDAPDADDPHSRVHEAPGAVLVATSDPALWEATKNARAKLGPVHLFDPGQLCDTPDRLRWAPHHGCADKATASARAAALLAPLRSPRPIDSEMHAAAETLLRCWLHAAALDDRPFREVHRWAQAKSAPTDPVQTLRTHPKASAGAAGELEATLTGHPERRREATQLIRRALSPLSQLHVRNACTATRADRIALESFIDETGTLYVVGENPELMPLLNALTQSVVEHGRRMAVRSSPGRLDPPLTTVLELPLDNSALPLPEDRSQRSK